MQKAMIERMNNFAGNPRPPLARRVLVGVYNEENKITKYTMGIITPHPNGGPRIEKVEVTTR